MEWWIGVAVAAVAAFVVTVPTGLGRYVVDLVTSSTKPTPPWWWATIVKRRSEAERTRREADEVEAAALATRVHIGDRLTFCYDNDERTGDRPMMEVLRGHVVDRVDDVVAVEWTEICEWWRTMSFEPLGTVRRESLSASDVEADLRNPLSGFRSDGTGGTIVGSGYRKARAIS